MDLILKSNAFLYGKGVFTTVAIYGCEPFLWNKHWRRLTANSKTVGIDISTLDEAEILIMLRRSINAQRITKGRGRITMFDTSESSVWSEPLPGKTDVSIIVSDLRNLPERFRVSISPYRVNSTSPLAGIKSCNYLENILAIDEAKARGYDEAIRLNESGEVVGGCMSNIFWLVSERLFTPDLSTGCLAGTTREFILENLKCSEVNEGIEVMKKADAIFLTSAGIGVKNVMMLDEISLNNIEHPILKLLPG